MCVFVVSGFVFHTKPRYWLGERLRNDLFCVGWDVKPVANIVSSSAVCAVAALSGTNVHEQSRSDFCRLRFRTHGVSRMYALSRDVTAPGVVVYDSGLCLCVSAFNGSRTRRSPRLTIKVG